MTSPATTAAPSTVVNAYRLYLVSAVLGLIGLVVSLVLLPEAIAVATREAQRQVQGQDTQGLDVPAIATAAAVGGVAIGGLFAVAFAVLTIVFARKLLRGRNWARIVLTVFAGLHLLGLLGLVGPGANVLVSVVSLLEIAASVVAAVLTYLPASAPWFRRTTLPPAAL